MSVIRMKKLNEIAEDLSVFDSDDDQYAEAWTAEDAEAAAAEQAELKAMGEEAYAAFSLAAYISFGSSCGFANSGSLVYVVNRRSDRAVRATVRVFWRQGINSGSYENVKDIPAGGRVLLGCTRSGNIPVAEYTYSVVGAQVL